MTRLIKRIFRSALLVLLAAVLFAGRSDAQGSRKDDIVFNALGRPMAGATVRICTSAATGQPCSPLALIYSDAGLTQALANPLSADGLGNYTFYAAPGRYEIEISGPSITTKQMPNVILPSDPSTPTFATVTTTSGISAFSLSLTGNLTVSGSAAVTGALTVGGAPIPSANQDNQWGANQRFKGAIPWRDFTAFMPAGGCSSTNLSDPNTLGSISSGSPILTLSSAIDFANGCGITVLHAGATSSLVMPSSCTATVSRTSNVVTASCSGNHYLYVNGSNTFGVDESVVVSGCSDASFNGLTTYIQTVPTATTLTYNQTASNSTATGCTISFLNGWAHGVTGSTPYYYKVAACDANAGCSAAVGPITIPNSLGTAGTTVSDNLTRANGALGSNWTTPANWYAPQIVSDKIGTAGLGYAAYYSGAGAIGANQNSTITYGGNTVTTTNVFLGPTFRGDSAGDFYACEYYNGYIDLVKYAAGAYVTTLGDTPATLVNGDTVTGSANGTTLSCAHNGTILFTTVDSSYATGYPGIMIVGTDTTDEFITGFSGGVSDVIGINAQNYNWVGWPIVNNSTGTAKIACVYRALQGSGLNNSLYTAVGTSVTMGFTDRGLVSPVFPSCPAIPPTSPTGQQLTTTIVSGAGTTRLTLAANASNSAAAQNVYHDETPFLLSCVAAVQADQNNSNAGSHGCLIPAGTYHFNSDTVTDSTTLSAAGGIAIYVDGAIRLSTWPWIFYGNDWSMQGMGFSGGQVGAGGHFPATQFHTGVNVADAFAVLGTDISIHGFALQSLAGNGVYMGPSIASDLSQSGLDLENLILTETSGATTSGVPIVFDSNSSYVTGKNLWMWPNGNGIPASILFTNNTYGGSPWFAMEFDNIFTEWHGIQFEAPGGAQSGVGAPISINHWESEEHGQHTTGGYITFDTGNVNGTPGTTPWDNMPHLTISQLDPADAVNQTLFEFEGQNLPNSLPYVSLYSSSGFYPLVSCAANSVVCANGGLVHVTSISDEQSPTGSAIYLGPYNNGNRFSIPDAAVISPNLSDYNVNVPAIADAIPPPKKMNILNTGVGSLAAGQYCMFVTGIGIASGGQTLPGPEVCQSVGANGAISVTWQLPSNQNWQAEEYADWYLYFGTGGPGSENAYVDTGIGPTFNYNLSYAFTTTSGAIGAAPPTVPTAYLSWLTITKRPACCAAAPTPIFLRLWESESRAFRPAIRLRLKAACLTPKAVSDPRYQQNRAPIRSLLRTTG